MLSGTGVKALSIVGALAVAALVAAQQPTPAEALRAAPKQYTVKDIPDTYRALSLGTEGFNMMAMYGMASMGGQNGGPETLLYKLFNATWVDPDEFKAALEGKVPRIRALTLDLGSMIRPGAGSEIPEPVFREGWLEASHIGSWSPLNELRKEELIKTFGAGDVQNSTVDETAALSQVKQISIGVLLYSGDFDDVLPKTNSTSQTATAIAPYLKSDSLWKTKNPAGSRILYNVALSGMSMVSIESPAETLMLWEENAWADGTRAVGYTDGHAKRLNEAQWQRLWKAELSRREMMKMVAKPMYQSGPGAAVPAKKKG